MKVELKIKPNNLQQKLIDSFYDNDIETVVALCNRQSGKSIGCEILIILALFLKEGSFSMWVSPTLKQSRKVFRDLIKFLPQKMVKISNASDLIIQLNNNSMIQFFSAEAIQSIRGFTTNGICVIDEAAFFPQSNWLSEVIIPTLKNAKQKKMFLISTPNGKQGTFYEMYLKAKSNEPKFKLIETNIYQDEFITGEEINNLKNLTPPLIFQQEYECKFLDNAITVFQGFEECFQNYRYNNTLNEWCGIDLSTVGSDNTVITFINELNQTEQHIIDSVNLDDKYQKIANLINQRKHLSKGYIETNSIGEPIFNEIRKLLNNKTILQPWLTNNASKNNIIDNLALYIANKDISFNSENKTLYKELGTFTYNVSPKTRKIIYGAKLGFHDDTVMSMAIALQAKEDFNLINNYHFVKRNR